MLSKSSTNISEKLSKTLNGFLRSWAIIEKNLSFSEFEILSSCSVFFKLSLFFFNSICVEILAKSSV